MAADLLPDEVIVEILSMLPAKSLLRCRLVCKSWLNLINSIEFKLMHLHNFNQLNKRYFVRRVDYLAGEERYNVHFDDEAFTLDTNVDFPFSVSRVIHWFRILVCCNGVVCLCDNVGSGSNRVILWNPSIRRNLPLPLPIFEDSLDVLGFGYDKMSDDFKLVRLIYYESTRRPRVEVYALKTGIWREVMFPDDLRCFHIHHYNRSQVFFDGCVHWIAASDPAHWVSHNYIMTFDTSTELFGEILLPDDLFKAQLSTMMISVVGESLAVTYYSGLTNSLIKGEKMASSTYKIWVMKEYNNPTSWTLMYKMHFPDVDMGMPWQVRNKGDMIMESRDGNIILYNYSGHASCICPGYESGSRSHFTTYVDKYQESLALLDVGHNVSDEAMTAFLMNG